MSRNVALLVGGAIAAEATGVTNFSGEDGEVGVPQIPGLPDIQLPDIDAPNVELGGLGRQFTDGARQAGQQFTENAGQQFEQLEQPLNNPLTNNPLLGVPPTEAETTAGDSWLQQGANRFGQEIGGVPMSLYGGAIDVGLSEAENTTAWIGRNNPLNDSGDPQRIRDVGSDVLGYAGGTDNPIDGAFENVGLESGFLQDIERPTVSGDVSNPLESLSTSGSSSGGSGGSAGSGGSGGGSSVSVPTASDMQSSASESVSSTVSSASESASSTVSSASESASSAVSSARDTASSTVSSASESASSAVSSVSSSVGSVFD